MKSLFCVLFALSLLVGCGKNGTLTPAQLQQMQATLAALAPSAVKTAKLLPANQFSSLLTNLASSGKVSPAQASVIANPQNQAILTGILQLVQGGTPSTQMAALQTVMGAIAGASTTANPLAEIIAVFIEIAPIIEIADPVIAPYIQVAVVVLPLVEAFINSIPPPAKLTASSGATAGA